MSGKTVKTETFVRCKETGRLISTGSCSELADTPCSVKITKFNPSTFEEEIRIEHGIPRNHVEKLRNETGLKIEIIN